MKQFEQVLFFKQKTAYEMRISDCSSDVCSSDLTTLRAQPHRIIVNLHRKFAGGRENEGAWLVRIVAFGTRMRQQVIHRREQQRGGFAGPGLGLASEIFAVQGLRERLCPERPAVAVAKTRESGLTSAERGVGKAWCSAGRSWLAAD